MNKKIVTIIFIIAAILLAIKGKSLLNERKNEVNNAPTPKEQPLYIQLASAKEDTLYQKEKLLANLLAKKSIKLSTKLAGFVKKVYVKESDLVKKGDILVEIDSNELKNSINSLKDAIKAQEKDLQVSKKIYQTNKKLYKIGGLPKEKLDLSYVGLKAKEANLNSSVQKLKSLQNQLRYLTIKAPFDAKVDAIILHEGDLAVTGKPILSLSSLKQKLVFSFAKQSNIKLKDKVLYKGTPIAGVSTIYNIANNGLLTAEATLTKPINLPVNSSINIEVVTKEKKGCTLPDTTILHNKDGNYIMAYSKKRFIPIKVDVLIEDIDKVLISPCPKVPVANASEAKLSSLPALKNVKIIGAKDE